MPRKAAFEPTEYELIELTFVDWTEGQLGSCADCDHGCIAIVEEVQRGPMHPALLLLLYASPWGPCMHGRPGQTQLSTLELVVLANRDIVERSILDRVLAKFDRMDSCIVR
jgi:hypothetical protein